MFILRSLENAWWDLLNFFDGCHHRGATSVYGVYMLGVSLAKILVTGSRPPPTILRVGKLG